MDDAGEGETTEVERPSSLAGLAGALSKAQAAFPQIPRDKTVSVSLKTGGSYTFKYAPLDTILAAVRGPLSENGLALAQLLDGTDLVTLLLHQSGDRLEGRTPLPRSDGSNIQALGSAITYLRRYAIQALLGIAAEEDDDGNHASGNRTDEQRPLGQHATPPPRPELERRTGNDGLIGKVATSGTQDFNLRQMPDGEFVLPFRVKEGNKAGQIVLAEGDLAMALERFRDTVIGQTVTVWGTYTDEESPPKPDGFVVRYKVLHLSRIQTPDFILPAPDAEPTVPTPAQRAEQAELDALPW